MASIKCTNCGAILKTQNPIAPGKKVKCPKCSEAFVVQADEEEQPKKKPAPAPEPEPQEDADNAFAGIGGDEEEAPKKKKGKPAADEDDEPAEGADQDDAPKKGKSKKSADDDEGEEEGDEKPKKKSNKMLFIILGVVFGVLTLLRLRTDRILVLLFRADGRTGSQGFAEELKEIG